MGHPWTRYPESVPGLGEAELCALRRGLISRGCCSAFQSSFWLQELDGTNGALLAWRE